MLDALAGTLVVEFDRDDWPASDFEAMGYKTHVLPIFIAVDRSGIPIGPVLTGDAWDATLPEKMAPSIKKFVASIKPGATR
jgi:hypothetical protein